MIESKKESKMSFVKPTLFIIIGWFLSMNIICNFRYLFNINIYPMINTLEANLYVMNVLLVTGLCMQYVLLTIITLNQNTSFLSNILTMIFITMVLSYFLNKNAYLIKTLEQIGYICFYVLLFMENSPYYYKKIL